MSILKMEEMTWKEVENIDKKKADIVQKSSELVLNFIVNDHIPELSKKIKSAMKYMVLR